MPVPQSGPQYATMVGGSRLVRPDMRGALRDLRGDTAAADLRADPSTKLPTNAAAAIIDDLGHIVKCPGPLIEVS